MAKTGRTPEGYNVHIRKRKDRNIEMIKLAKSVPCLDCKGDFPWYVMEFDHTRGEKKFNICGRAYTLTQLQEEIAKCDVVCANCHNVRTYLRRISE